MFETKKEIAKSLVSDIFDLLFKGRNKKVKTVGNMDSFSPEDMSKFALVRSLLGEEIAEVEREIKNEVLEDNFNSDSSLKRLMRLARTWKAMKLLTSDEETELPEIFITDPLFLKECYSILFPAKVERELFLTGVKIGKFNVLTKRVKIKEREWKSHVEDLPESSHRELKRIDKLGMPFLGAFHSHPGTLNPGPSKTDLNQFESYEEHGHRALGAIFTKNGLLRFFTQNLDFEILITGSKLEKKRRNLYRLELEEV